VVEHLADQCKSLASSISREGGKRKGGKRKGGREEREGRKERRKEGRKEGNTFCVVGCVL
jgi:hypothetical protein